jgi:hypothetical protein
LNLFSLDFGRKPTPRVEITTKHQNTGLGVEALGHPAGLEVRIFLRAVFPYVEVGSIIMAPSSTVWNLIADTSRWAEWGPSIRAVKCSDRLITLLSSGRIRTVLGFSVPFVVTHFDVGRAWSWRIFGIPATTHTVEPLDKNRCLLRFGVPILVFPYLIVCLIAIRRIAELAEAAQDHAST